MKSFGALLLVLTLLVSCKEDPKVSESQSLEKNFIIGGTTVDSLKIDTSFMVGITGGCGGTIIAPQWILTAAHCQNLFKRKIFAGVTERDSGRAIVLNVKEFFIHPQYEDVAMTIRNDFALLKLEEPINFKNTRLSALPIADEAFRASGAMDEGVMATVYGWGITAVGNWELPNELQSLEVPIVSLERANASGVYDGDIDETMIAAGFDEGKKDSCSGDSGGPLIAINKETNKPTLIGVVSFGDGCARPKKYGIYGNVAYAHDWIVETMRR